MLNTTYMSPAAGTVFVRGEGIGRVRMRRTHPGMEAGLGKAFGDDDGMSYLRSTRFRPPKPV
jgi:hypothetical protein